MARRARVEVAGGVHHVTCRGNRRQAIFIDDEDRRRFVAELAKVVADRDWRCLSWTLMPNHVHVVVETPQTDLGVGMHRVLSRYAYRFNDRHGFVGHLTQERYHSVLVRREAHFAHLLRYVALNPVIGGLCDDPLAWPWSSHRALMARREGPLSSFRRVEELLGCWGRPIGERYAWLLAPTGLFGRWRDATSPLPPRPTLDELLAAHSVDEAMRAARWDHGYRLAEIAAATGVSVPTVSRRTRRR